jgi:hypothetical protein
LDKEKLYVRPGNGNIVHKGDIEVPGEIETTFYWFDDKLFLNDVVKTSILSSFSFSIYHSAIHQLIGLILDQISSKTRIRSVNKEQQR